MTLKMITLIIPYIQHIDTLHNDTQHKETQYIDTQHRGLI
jgi:hypothetical protein